MNICFRKFPEGDVIALLIGLDANPGKIVSYQHIGQHSEADKSVTLATKPATRDEYISLEIYLRKEYGERVFPVDSIRRNTHCFLSYAGEYLSDAKPFPSVSAAVDSFRESAMECWRYGQRLEASIHIAPHNGHIAEYPDFVLSVGPRGGIKKERC